MTNRNLIIVVTAGLVTIGLGYGLMGLAAPKGTQETQSTEDGFVLDAAALEAALAGPDGTGPQVLFVDAAPTNSSANWDDDENGDEEREHDRTGEREDHDDDD